MSQDKPQLFNTSRRQVLAGLGAVGLASAGAGLGTTAYFSDEETFENNQLVAGELDLKVDWEAFYYGPSETLDPIGAFPDVDGDMEQDDILSRDELANSQFGDTYGNLTAENQTVVEGDYRMQFADVPQDQDKPVFELDDVKPGDWGEVTFSMHLFDNPGYIWLGGDLYDEMENGRNEPEMEADTDDDTGELADAIQACLFYDENGNNQFDRGTAQETCIALVLDDSGSMSGTKSNNLQTAADQLVNTLAGGGSSTAPNEFIVSLFGTNVSLYQPPTTDVATIKAAIDEADGNAGGTNVSAGMERAEQDLLNCTGRRVMVILTNGSENSGSNALQSAKDLLASGAVDQYITIGVETGTNTSAQQLLIDIAALTSDSRYIDVSDSGNLTDAFNDIITILGGDTKIVPEGTLREVMAAIKDGVPLDGNRIEDGRQCYPNSTTQYFALKWWLPTDVGNEIQSDSLKFDLSLYAEQCRHNDGSNNPFAPAPTATATDSAGT